MFSRNLESLAKYVCESNRKRNILSVDTESVSTDKISLLQINIELKRIKCEFQMKSNSLWKIPSTISSSRNLITLSYSGKTQISVCLLRNVRNYFFFFSFSTIAHLYFFFSPLPPIHTVSFDWFLSGLEWILNLEFCLLKLLIFYQKLLWNIRSRLNSSTFWVFEPVFKYVWSKSSFFVHKASILIKHI